MNECFLVFRISSNREAPLWCGECQYKFNTNLSRVLWSPLPCPMGEGLPAIMTKPHTQCLMKEVSPLHSHVEEGGVWAWNFAPESTGAGGTPLLSGFSVCKGEGAEFQTGGWFEVGDDAPTGSVEVGWHWVSRWGGLYLPQIPLLWMKGRQALGKNQKRGGLCLCYSLTHSLNKHSWIISYVPGTALDAEIINTDKTRSLLPISIHPRKGSKLLIIIIIHSSAACKQVSGTMSGKEHNFKGVLERIKTLQLS